MNLRIASAALAVAFAFASRAQDEAAAWAEMVESANWMEGVYADVAVMAEVLLLIKNQYVEEKDARGLMYGAIHGMVESLDAHSEFLEAEDLAAQVEEVEGSFFGVGISAAIEDGELVVVSLMEGSPAEQAGILAGDKIVSVDGKPTQGMTMKQVVRAFRGALGTELRVEIGRARSPGEPQEHEKFFEATLTRTDIPVKTVFPQALDDGVILIRVSQFTEKTVEEFETAMLAVNWHKKLNATALILDLRDNPGGVVLSAVKTAELLFPGGTLLYSTRWRDDEIKKSKTSLFPKDVTKLPMVVLVNNKTASAAEILAGALQDHKRAVIVGERTVGKASVQQVARLRLRPEVGVKLTVARYFTPSGRMIQGEGITPDIFAGEDALERAVEILKAARIFGKGAGYAK